MDLDELIRLEPKFHSRDGQPISWRLSDEVLRFIYERTGPESRTLETGEGVSTVVFALRGAAHRCISPNEPAIALIRQFCIDHSISLANVTFEVSRSDTYLPGAKLEPLDLVLIDGGHGLPIPFLDWFYTASALKPGGMLVIDDTQLWTAATLSEFLLMDEGWSLTKRFERTVAIEKIGDGEIAKEWTDQPFVASMTHSLQPGEPSLVRRVAGRALRRARRRNHPTSLG